VVVQRAVTQAPLAPQSLEVRPIADIFPHLWNGKRALVEWEEAEKNLLGANASPRTTVPPALFEALSAQVHAWKAQAVQLERDGAPAPGPGNHHRWRDGPDPRQAPLEAVMALHGFSFKREAHAKALLAAVNGVCAEARRKEAKLLATEREARGPAGDASRLTVVTDTLDAMVRMCGLPRAEATDACVTAGVALLSRADEALAEGARAAQGASVDGRRSRCHRRRWTRRWPPRQVRRPSQPPAPPHLHKRPS
jgi:hypothetical protein